MSQHRKIEQPTSDIQISLTAEEAAAARGLLLQLLEKDTNGEAAKVELHEIASRIHDARRARRYFFPDDLFAEPAWDMILSLYCAQACGERLSVTALGQSVGLAQTTALRWIKELDEAGLIERVQDQHDRRRYFLTLTADAQAKVAQWLQRVGSLFRSLLEARI